MSKARRLRRSLALLLGLVLLGTAPARAQAPSEEAIRFQYAAPPECPTEATFTARVRERTARGRLAEPDELARTFNVGIAAAAGGFTGTVHFLDDAGTRVSRRISGEQCDEVVSSLALITALALDATLRPTESADPGPRPANVEPPEQQRRETKGEVQRAPTRWVDSASKGPSARVGVAGGYRVPLDAYSLGLLGELDYGRVVGVRLAAHYASADRALGDGRRANLRLMGVEASACAPRELLSTTFIHFCGALDVGSLRAEGLESPGLTSLDSGTILWVAVGAELRLAWEPDAPFWLELNAQLGVPLVNHRFIFENPDTTVFEIEGLDPTAGAGVATGVRFW